MAFLSSNMFDLLTNEHIEALNDIGIWTINDFCSKNLMEIRRKTQVKFPILKQLEEKIKDRYVLQCHDLGYELGKSIRKCKMVPTGLPELTQALEGGFQTQEIVELFGESESGKTELCYLLCGEILSHYDDYQILFATADFDICYEKLAHYTKIKSGNRFLSDDDLHKALSRVEIAKPACLADLVHLLNTLVHCDKHDLVKCIVIDSLSFLIQEDVLDIINGDEFEKFTAFNDVLSTNNEQYNANIELGRRIFKDIYLHELMRLLTNVAQVKNVIILITNSDNLLSASKSWTNGIDHRILLEAMPKYLNISSSAPHSTFRRATIIKTIHNISKIGYSISFCISDEGLFTVRQATKTEDNSSTDDNANDDQNQK